MVSANRKVICANKLGGSVNRTWVSANRRLKVQIKIVSANRKVIGANKQGGSVNRTWISANRSVESANKNGVCKKSTNSQIPKILILYIMSPKNVQGKHYRRTNFIEE